jgi:catechol 2,3-dioxygenase-like lactoylglutathione lyase family enzyme
MIDHLTLRVADYAKSKAFFLAALKPLGYEAVMEFEGFCGLGEGGKPDFWLAAGKQEPAHIAFLAKNHAAVDAFHAAALKAGAKDNGAPGPREAYHPSFYGAFVIDPDGHNLEAVCYADEP